MAYQGAFHLANADNIAFIMGVTDPSTDTALATLCPNPFGHTRVFAMVFGEGVYVEDDGTVRPRQSGVVAATIDVRSSVASAAFTGIVIELGGGAALTRDHSGTTT